MAQEDVSGSVDRWLRGDDSAYRELFDFYYPRLFHLSYRSIKQREDSEETVLNVFLNIWQKRDNLKQVENFEKYLFRALLNQVTDFQRKRIMQTEDIDTQSLNRLGATRQPELSFKELERRYQHALNRLPEKQRTVFLMSRELGLTQKQIAGQNNISINTVNNHIKSAVKSIRRDLGDYAEALSVVTLLGSSGMLQ